MAKIYDFYKYVDRKENIFNMNILNDSSRQLNEEEKEKERLINEIETLANKMSLGIYDYVE